MLVRNDSLARLWMLDFGARTAHAVAFEDVRTPVDKGQFRWLDVSAEQVDVQLLDALANGRPDEFTHTQMRELEFADGWLAFGLIEPTREGAAKAGVNVLFSQTAMITVEFGRSETLTKLRLSWREDFQQFARSPGFFLFELSDHYTTVSQTRLHHSEHEVEAMQSRLFDESADDSVFGATAALMQRLSEMRQFAVIAEETFEELATRSSTFIATSTQPFISRNATRMARLAAELLQQRDSLMSALNLYIGMTGHRTGQLLKRLTAFSMIFLPLGFLAGVFGMNFKYFPGLEWEFGYPMFWGMVMTVTFLLLFAAKRGKWF